MIEEYKDFVKQVIKSVLQSLFYVIGNCDAISYYRKTLREDAQTAEMELIAAQYRGRARVLQAKLFVLLKLLSVDMFRANSLIKKRINIST